MFVFPQAERLRKQAEQEKIEAVDNLNTVTNQNNTLTQAKRKLEGTIGTLQEEAEDLENEAKNADDRAKKAAIEVTLRFNRLIGSITSLLQQKKWQRNVLILNAFDSKSEDRCELVLCTDEHHVPAHFRISLISQKEKCSTMHPPLVELSHLYGDVLSLNFTLLCHFYGDLRCL